MSKTILQKLFDGEIYPSESIICTDPKYRQAAHRLCDTKESFISSLSEKDRKIFDDIESLTVEVHSLYNYECFSEGFRIGVMLMSEIPKSGLLRKL